MDQRVDQNPESVKPLFLERFHKVFALNPRLSDDCSIETIQRLLLRIGDGPPRYWLRSPPPLSLLKSQLLCQLS